MFCWCIRSDFLQNVNERKRAEQMRWNCSLFRFTMHTVVVLSFDGCLLFHLRVFCFNHKTVDYFFMFILIFILVATTVFYTQTQHSHNNEFNLVLVFYVQLLLFVASVGYFIFLFVSFRFYSIRFLFFAHWRSSWPFSESVFVFLRTFFAILFSSLYSTICYLTVWFLHTNELCV